MRLRRERPDPDAARMAGLTARAYAAGFAMASEAPGREAADADDDPADGRRRVRRLLFVQEAVIVLATAAIVAAFVVGPRAEAAPVAAWFPTGAALLFWTVEWMLAAVAAASAAAFVTLVRPRAVDAVGGFWHAAAIGLTALALAGGAAALAPYVADVLLRLI